MTARNHHLYMKFKLDLLKEIKAILKAAEMPDADIEEITELVRTKLAGAGETTETIETATTETGNVQDLADATQKQEQRQDAELAMPDIFAGNVFVYQKGLKLPTRMQYHKKNIERPIGRPYADIGIVETLSGKDFAASSYTDIAPNLSRVGVSLLNKDALTIECNDYGEVISFAVGDGVSNASFFSSQMTKIVTRILAHTMMKRTAYSDREIGNIFERMLKRALQEWDEKKREAVRVHVQGIIAEIRDKDGHTRHLSHRIDERASWNTMVSSGYINRKKGTLRLQTFGDTIVIVIDKDTGIATHITRGSTMNQVAFFETAEQGIRMPSISFETIPLPKNYRIIACTDGMLKQGITEAPIEKRLEPLTDGNLTPEQAMQMLIAKLDEHILDDDTTALVVDGVTSS